MAYTIIADTHTAAENWRLSRSISADFVIIPTGPVEAIEMIRRTKDTDHIILLPYHMRANDEVKAECGRAKDRGVRVSWE